MLIRFIFFYYLMALPLYSQKEYKFDYLLQYNIVKNDSITGQSQYYFVNSKDNSAILYFSEFNGKVIMLLKDSKSKLYHGEIPRDDFFVLMIAMRCPRTLDWDKGDDYEYEYTGKKDTIINAVPFFTFKTRPINKKKASRKNLKTLQYLYEPHPDFSMPVVLTHRLAYDFWKSGDAKISGVLKELYFFNPDGTISGVSKLTKIIRLDKIIIIDTNCK